MPDPIPALVLGRLVVDCNWQGQNIGRGLLKDDLARAINVSEQVGVRVIIVHVLNERDRWMVYSRAQLGSASPGLPVENRVLGIIDWEAAGDKLRKVQYAYDNDSSEAGDWKHNHGGCVQAVGKYFVLPLETVDDGGVCNCDNDKRPSEFKVIIQNVDNIINDIYDPYPEPDLIFGDHDANELKRMGNRDGVNFKYLAGSGFMRESTGKYLFINGYYKHDIAQTRYHRYFLSYNTSMAQDPNFERIGEKIGDSIAENILDLGKNTYCQTESGQTCQFNKDYQGSFLIPQSDGQIYLFLTHYKGGQQDPIQMYRVYIDKMTDKVSLVELGIKGFNDTGALTFKAGIGMHIDQNGELNVFTTELGFGAIDWGRWKSN